MLPKDVPMTYSVGDTVVFLTRAEVREKYDGDFNFDSGESWFDPGHDLPSFPTYMFDYFSGRRFIISEVYEDAGLPVAFDIDLDPTEDYGIDRDNLDLLWSYHPYMIKPYYKIEERIIPDDVSFDISILYS